MTHPEYKGAQKDFQETVEKGRRGEERVLAYLVSQGYRFVEFLHPGELTEQKIPIEIKQLFKKAPYLRLDFIVRSPNGEVSFVDAKYKSAPKFIVNESDYRAYSRLVGVIPVYIYFFIESEKKVYRHRVRNDYSFKAKRMYNGNRVYVIPRRLIEPLEVLE